MWGVRAEGSERDGFRVFVLSNEDQHCHELRMMGINALSMRAVGGEGVGSWIWLNVLWDAFCLEQVVFTAVAHLRYKLASKQFWEMQLLDFRGFSHHSFESGYNVPLKNHPPLFGVRIWKHTSHFSHKSVYRRLQFWSLFLQILYVHLHKNRAFCFWTDD